MRTKRSSVDIMAVFGIKNQSGFGDWRTYGLGVCEMMGWSTNKVL